ncbi:MAG TPA: DNA-processing protein DprA [Polyangiaceae bacterium]|nr:DNA-processing protein DprA [Polyangiaceae bacterium]
MRSQLPIVLVGDKLPPRLSDLQEPPEALYVRGELPRGPAVAIVGTRSPTPEGETFARTLAAELAAAGIAILSGGAKGIDTAAHVGALSARGTTVVVAPAGFARAYPEENEELFLRVLSQGGCYVARVPDDEPATRAGFFARNACLVALSHVVVVVQAGLRSGARNAAAQARRLGRPLLVVPSAPWIGRGLGCLAELRQGARSCERAEDVLLALSEVGCAPIPLTRSRRNSPHKEERRESRRKAQRSAREVSALGAEFMNDSDDSSSTRSILKLLREGAHHPDQLGALAGLSAAETQRVLLTLRLRGVLACDPTGRLVLRNHSD